MAFSTPHSLSFISSTYSSTTSSFASSSTGSYYAPSESYSYSSYLSSYSSASSVSDNVYSTIATDSWASASGGGGGTFGTITDAVQPTATSSSDSDSDSGSGDDPLSPTEKKVIGGVVGSVAGLAFLVVFVLLALKYKKRQNGQGLLGGALAGSAPRAITDGGSGAGSGGGNGGGGDGDGTGSGTGSGAARGTLMSERSASSAVTAALATLTGKRNISTAGSSTEGGERGFYRVSGKKLPSVLQSGGDGYSDPRESVMSGNTEYWRGSQAFEPVPRSAGMLALGSPMRPVSGVPIIRTGPARTPVTEQNPFADPKESSPQPRPQPPARPDSDALGRSLVSLDGSRGSPSRFHEGI